MEFLTSPRSSQIDQSHTFSQTHIFGSSRSPVRFIQRIIPNNDTNKFTAREKLAEEFKVQNELEKCENTEYFKHISFNQGITKLQRPFIPGIPLSELVIMQGPLDTQVILSIFEKVIREVAELHKRGIVLRNLKLENIILNGDKPYIIDFGFDFLYEDTKQSSPIMTLLFGGPEGLDGSRIMTKELDIYHFGLALYVLCFGHYPWASVNQARITKQMLTNTIPISDSLGSEIADLLRKCLASDPAERPTATQLHMMIIDLMHPNISKFSNGKICNPVSPSKRPLIKKPQIKSTASIMTLINCHDNNDKKSIPSITSQTNFWNIKCSNRKKISAVKSEEFSFLAMTPKL